MLPKNKDHLYFLSSNVFQEKDGSAHHGSTSVPESTARHTWPEHPLMKDSFWKKALSEAVEAGLNFEYLCSGFTGNETLLNRQA